MSELNNFQYSTDQVNILKNVHASNIDKLSSYIGSLDRRLETHSFYHQNNISKKQTQYKLNSNLKTINQTIRQFNISIDNTINESKKYGQSYNDDYEYLNQKKMQLELENHSKQKQIEMYLISNQEKKQQVNKLINQLNKLEVQNQILQIQNQQQQIQKLKNQNHLVDRILAYQDQTINKNLSQQEYCEKYKTLINYFKIKLQDQDQVLKKYTQIHQQIILQKQKRQRSIIRYKQLEQNIQKLKQKNQIIQKKIQIKIASKKQEIEKQEQQSDEKIISILKQQIPSYDVQLKTWINAFNKVTQIVKKSNLQYQSYQFLSQIISQNNQQQ